MAQAMQVLVVDDEETICLSLAAWLFKAGYRVETAGSGQEALTQLKQRLFDIYLLDIKMPSMDGLELLAEIKALQPDAAAIMITAHGSIQTAVASMKKGAVDYLCKPFDPDELSLVMERVAATKALKDENEVLRMQLMEQQAAFLEGIVAQSAAMHAVLADIEEMAPSNAAVLITGETGVGKDLVARMIHLRSRQAQGPFIAVNCGAQTESLLESELFGHERGAFTGAVKARRGLLEMADGGTLFLDEIGEITQKMQVALLRVLEDKHFQRLGGGHPIDTQFRLICATHRDLLQLRREELFREDFFYRINVFSIHVPPLRQRREDIPVLADFFLQKYNQETGKRIEGFTQNAMAALCAYPWPGNARELRNVVERVVVLTRGRMIGAAEIAFLEKSADACDSDGLTLKALEQRHINSVLAACEGNITHAAKRLGIDRVTLSRKLKRYQASLAASGEIK
ncbi:MAG: sigma-54-dependent Fis family transcriptional regulator [Desulfatitalea sp.]|nr:sigma-54 dependent transcriptional regulator [Desulfatitalea sp.]NNK02019.1 sigma-54-dependent Fis family transcriptional regulator [Desulfatitalea sp.]